jgi:protocatechuate 3,4-dioxygenase beta subunit
MNNRDHAIAIATLPKPGSTPGRRLAGRWGHAALGLLLAALCALLAGPGLAAAAEAAPAANITVPNGDFSDPGNFGSVGGGLLGATGTDIPIGAGPWSASYSGILGLLAPPTLEIDAGTATISGLAGINLLGLLNNSGSFNQTLPAQYEPGRIYTLSADVNVGALLGIGALRDGLAGISLTREDGTVASTVTSPGAFIDITVLDGTTYHLELSWASDASASGAIGIRLFGSPQDVATVNLFSTVTFSNVALSSRLANPTAEQIVVASGSGQSTTVNTVFPQPLEVRVIDADGDGVANATVTFDATGSGAGATLSATTVETDADGYATVTATANSVAGSYSVAASVDGVTLPAGFQLTNLAGAPSAISAFGGAGQSTAVNTPFPAPLVVRVVDEFGNPVPGAGVTFDAPVGAASADLATPVVTTDSNGLAQTFATANGLAGSYEVLGSVGGVTAVAHLALTNLAGVPTSITTAGGDDQTTAINTPFPAPLTVHVTDAGNNPVAGITVLFAVPSTGASATLSSLTAQTDAAGDAEITATANAIAGSYAVSANVGGVATAASFDLTNTAGPASHVIADSGTPQSAVVHQAFGAPLVVKVTDAGGNPVAGETVEFTVPGNGASASVTPVSAVTDVNGEASATGTANGIAGSYVVSASVSGVSGAASFNLTNMAGAPAAIALVGGDSQSAIIGMPFADPLVVKVTDADGNAVSGAAVDYAVPSSGASATLAGTLVTGADGQTLVFATANALVGSYTVSASVAGVADIADFHLTNTYGTGILIDPISGVDQGANIGDAFTCLLAVQVTDNGLPMGGVNVAFEAPTSGASSILSDGVNSGTSLQVPTDPTGVALVQATANDIAGSYVVTATLVGSTAPPASFHLTNFTDLIFANGFDHRCIVLP